MPAQAGIPLRFSEEKRDPSLRWGDGVWRNYLRRLTLKRAVPKAWRRPYGRDLNRLFDERRRPHFRFVQTKQIHECRLAFIAVLLRGLTEGFRRRLHIQDVVGDLECRRSLPHINSQQSATSAPRAAEAADLVVRGARTHNLKNIDVTLPHRQADHRHGRERIGQVVARLRHDLRRRTAPLRRVAVGLRAPVPRADGEAGRRSHRRHRAGHRDPPEEQHPQSAVDRRHDDRDPRLHAAAVRARRPDVLPATAAGRSSARRPKSWRASSASCRRARGCCWASTCPSSRPRLGAKARRSRRAERGGRTRRRSRRASRQPRSSARTLAASCAGPDAAIARDDRRPSAQGIRPAAGRRTGAWPSTTSIQRRSRAVRCCRSSSTACSWRATKRGSG